MRTYLVVGVLAVILAAIAFHFSQVGVLKRKIKNLEAEKAELALDNTLMHGLNDQLTAANQGCKEAVQRQNDQIKAMNDSMAAASTMAADAISKAEADKVKWQKAFKQVLTIPKPVEGLKPGETLDPGPVCESLDQRLKQYIEIRHRGV